MRVKHLIIWLLIFMPAIVSANSDFLDSFRCGNKYIELGMSVSEFRRACGTAWMPDEIRTEIRHYKTPKEIRHFVDSLPPSANTYQFWIYREYGRYSIWLWVVNGIVERIERGDRQ